jgi:hypothetical protein
MAGQRTNATRQSTGRRQTRDCRAVDLALRHASAAETSIGHAFVYIGAITQKHLMRFLEEYDEAASGLNRPLADLSSSGSTTGPMTEDDSRFLRDWDDQLCPTLKTNYDLVQKLERIPICVACPMAQWYKLEAVPSKPNEEAKPAALECFCTAFRGVMYDGRKVVTACDAFQDALDKQDDQRGPRG